MEFGTARNEFETTPDRRKRLERVGVLEADRPICQGKIDQTEAFPEMVGPAFAQTQVDHPQGFRRALERMLTHARGVFRA